MERKIFPPGESFTSHALDVLVVGLRLFLPRSSTNFKRNPAFAASFMRVLQEVLGYAATLPNCLKVEQQSHSLRLTFRQTKRMRVPLYPILCRLRAIEMRCGEEETSDDLRFCLAADFGAVEMSGAYAAHPLFGNYLWLGEVQERAMLLAKAAGTQGYPDCLLSHAAYEQMGRDDRRRFPRKYYYDHICCYGVALDTDGAILSHYSESCGVQRVL